MKVTEYNIKDNTTGIIYGFKKKDHNYYGQLKCLEGHDITETQDFINIHFYIEIGLINNKGQEFEKGFDDKHEAIVFLNKLRRGNKLKVTSIACPSTEVFEELNYYSKDLK